MAPSLQGHTQDRRQIDKIFLYDRYRFADFCKRVEPCSEGDCATTRFVRKVDLRVTGVVDETTLHVF